MTLNNLILLLQSNWKFNFSRDSDNKSQAREYELEIKNNLFNGTFIASRCSVKSDKTKSLFIGVSKKKSQELNQCLIDLNCKKNYFIVFLELAS